MFDLVEKKDSFPEWLDRESPIAIKMYKLSCEYESAIMKRLNEGEILKPRERKISFSKISTDIGKNSAYLNRRDYKDLYDHIVLRNQQIEQKFNHIRSAIKEKGNVKNQLDKMSRSELMDRCREKNAEVDKLHQVIASNALDYIYDKSLSANRFGNIGMVKTLQEDNERLQSRNAELVDQIHNQQREIIAAMEEIDRLKKMAKNNIKSVK